MRLLKLNPGKEAKFLPRSNPYLPAVSIVESMVAMVLIIMSFGMGMAIFLQVMTSDKVESKAKARVVLNQIMTETKYKESLINETFENEGLQIIKKTEPWFTPDFEMITIQALNGKGELLGEIKELIYLPIP